MMTDDEKNNGIGGHAKASGQQTAAMFHEVFHYFFISVYFDKLMGQCQSK